jgi:hypothetical protein
MPRNLPSTQAQLISLGLESVLLDLIGNNITQPREISFPSLKTAARVQRLLYTWLWFYPEIKERISLTLDDKLGTLVIKPGLPEKRGRRGSKII